MVRSTFFGFEASKSALFSSQKALDIVGNNLANANTDGYTRQRVETTATTYSASINRFSTSTVGQAGAGVTTLGVSQIRDQFIDKNYRGELSDSSYYGKAKEIMTEIQGAIPDAADITTDSGLTGALENIYTALSKYVQNPTYESEANIVKSSFASMVQVLHDASNSLDEIEARETADLGTTVDRVNTILQNIQLNNSAISTQKNSLSTTDSAYFSPNELMDRQNLLLDELSKYTNISVSQNPDKTVNVSFVNADSTETQVVNGADTASKVATLSNKDANNKDTTTLKLTTYSKQSDGTFTASGPAAFSSKSGTLKSYVDVLTGNGAKATAAGEGTTQGVPYYRTMLDSFAKKLVEVANNAIPATTDSNGTIKTETDPNDPTKTVTVYKGLLGSKDASGTVTATATGVTAANISISSEWAKDSSYFIFNKNDNVEDYAQRLLTKISGKGDEKFQFGAFTKDSNSDGTLDAYDNSSETFTGNFENYVTNMVGKIGTDVSANTNSYTAKKAVADDFLSQRESNSGVQRDEETANMLVYQKAYQASARIMSVMDNLLDTLINDLGAKIS